jgi:hypothetical protein
VGGAYVVALLLVLALGTFLAAWRAGVTGSRAWWLTSILGLASLATVYVLLAAPQINRPSEADAEVYWRRRYETTEVERRSIIPQLEKYKETATRIDAAISRAEVADRAREQAAKERDVAIARANALASEAKRTEGKIAELYTDLEKARAETSRLDRAFKDSMAAQREVEKLFNHTSRLMRLSTSREMTTRSRLLTAERRLALVEAKSTSEPRLPAVTLGISDAVLKRIASRVQSDRYVIEPKSDCNQILSRPGRCFSVSIQSEQDREVLFFANVQPPLVSNQDLLASGVNDVLREIILPLQATHDLVILVRGSADTRPIRKQPDHGSVKAYLGFANRKPTGKATYGDAGLDTIVLPLTNEALPNLRGSYVAHYINSALEKEGSNTRASILSQRPTVPPGPSINRLRPEVFLLIFEK